MFIFTNKSTLPYICSWSYGVVLYEIFTVGKLLFFLINDNGLIVVETSLATGSGDVVCFFFLYFQVVVRIREWMARKLLAYFNKDTGCPSRITWMRNCKLIYFFHYLFAKKKKKITNTCSCNYSKLFSTFTAG